MNDVNQVSEIVQKYFELKEKMIALGYHPIGIANKEIVKTLGNNLPELLIYDGISEVDMGNGIKQTNILLIDWNFLPESWKTYFSVEAVGI